MITFQKIIQILIDFWAEKGCIVHQPYDVETGAGTFNPATFLRSLGPEPYNTVHVETSRRPQDGRYGQNPNRVQLFHQLQVIMKPSPVDIQEMYLESLSRIGFDLSKHDVRFVHDDWESPTLGAWGLGWEVWMDGMEITQFTYFQAVGGLTLDPIPAEIAYGLERIAMLLEKADHFYQIHWSDTVTYKEVSQQSEVEWSTYNFEKATTSMWQNHFRDFVDETKQLIGQDLPLPAYDFVLKASHAFNILEARGVLSVTERTGYIAKIRELACAVAAKYVEKREKEGFPLLKHKAAPLEPEAPLPEIRPFSTETEDFLFEIGSEQLPATFVPIGMQQLELHMKNFFASQKLDYESIKVFATPRRLAVLVSKLATHTKPATQTRKGPAIDTAFDESGMPTPQGMGFLRSVGFEEPVVLSAFEKGHYPHIGIQDLGKKKYLFAKIDEKRQETFDLLREHLPKIIKDLSFPKKMRWADFSIEYPRPIRWILALFGKEPVPFRYGPLDSGRISFGHMQIDPSVFTIEHPSLYVTTLKKHFVLIDVEQRKNEIHRQLTEIEKKIDGLALKKPRVTNEVLHLVEWPELIVGNFNESFLKAPAEVLISEMVEHQRYYPLADFQGVLKNAFVITADNHPNDEIQKGNEKVLSARLSDGVFLYEQDLKTSLDTFAEKLKNIIFQKELGSIYDKTQRIASIAEILRNFFQEDREKVKRAAQLCKADLATQLVGEFPELQGTIGKEYALQQKEDRAVAEAIEEHWLPKQEGGALPKTPLGSILSLSDKIDNLLGYFSIGLIPTSSSDPYALRRQTLGLLKILIENHWRIDLSHLLENSCHSFPKLHGEVHKQKELVAAIMDYITTRSKTIYEEYGFKKDEIEAILKGSCKDPYDQYCRLAALKSFRESGEDFSNLFEVYKRAKGQLEEKIHAPFQLSLAKEEQEKHLAHELSSIDKVWKETLSQADYTTAFKLLTTLQKPLANLFDNVRILAEDPAIRQNRLALLQMVFNRFADLLDFSKIQQHS